MTTDVSAAVAQTIASGRLETLVSIKDVCFHYPTRNGQPPRMVLQGVNAEIRNVPHHGQVVGFLGPSGVGKSTLANIMAGVEVPTAGSVTIQLNSHTVPVEAGLMGLVWQNYPLLKHRTVGDNLSVVGELAGMSFNEARAKARELLTQFGITELTGKFAPQLSGGQRQRVAIAQQLMRKSHYILMDEPFSGLDPVAKAKVVQMIRQVADLNELNTFVIITHDVTAALEVSDQLWLMGRDRDPAGNIISGARIVQEYDLIEMGLAYRADLADLPLFHQLMRDLKLRFNTL